MRPVTAAIVELTPLPARATVRDWSNGLRPEPPQPKPSPAARIRATQRSRARPVFRLPEACRLPVAMIVGCSRSYSPPEVHEAARAAFVFANLGDFAGLLAAREGRRPHTPGTPRTDGLEKFWLMGRFG